MTVANGHLKKSTLVEQANDTFYVQMDAVISYAPNLREYPFDSQGLPVVLEHADASAKQAQLVANTATSG